MDTLGSLSRLVRSKNAGPFMLTFDIMFDDEPTYRRVLASGALTRESFAETYRLPIADVRFFACDAAHAIKVSIPRPYPQCDLEDGDCYGGQQYAQLLDIPIP